MDPKLKQALPGIIARLRAGQTRQGFQAASELEAYLNSDGHTNLTPMTMALVGPMAQAAGVALTPPTPAPGAPPQAAPGAPAAQTANPAPAQTTGQFSPDRGRPVGGPINLTTPPAAATGGVRAGTVNIPQDSPNTPPATSSTPFRLSPLPGDENNMPTPPQALPGQASPPPLPTGPSVAPGAGGGDTGLPGGFSGAQGRQLSQDDNLLLQFAMRAAGFNPNILTPATKIAMAALKPLVAARRAAFGAGDEGQNVGFLPQDIASFAKEYTTPGANFYGNARQYAQGILGGKSFSDFISGLQDPMDQYGMYQALVPLLYGGANPMIQQSVADQLQSQQNDYNYLDFQQQGKEGSILDVIRNNPNLSPALRSIFGPAR